MKTMFISAAVMLLLYCYGEDKLTGRWQTQPSVNGVVTGIVFKTDNSFEGYVNKKPFVSGKYTMKDDVLSFTDNGCDGKPAEYKIVLSDNNDSLRFQVIMDSCDRRKEGMLRLVLGKVK
jgi:hypothetical protein